MRNLFVVTWEHQSRATCALLKRVWHQATKAQVTAVWCPLVRWHPIPWFLITEWGSFLCSYRLTLDTSTSNTAPKQSGAVCQEEYMPPPLPAVLLDGGGVYSRGCTLLDTPPLIAQPLSKVGWWMELPSDRRLRYRVTKMPNQWPRSAGRSTRLTHGNVGEYFPKS